MITKEGKRALIDGSAVSSCGDPLAHTVDLQCERAGFPFMWGDPKRITMSYDKETSTIAWVPGLTSDEKPLKWEFFTKVKTSRLKRIFKSKLTYDPRIGDGMDVKMALLLNGVIVAIGHDYKPGFPLYHGVRGGDTLEVSAITIKLE